MKSQLFLKQFIYSSKNRQKLENVAFEVSSLNFASNVSLIYVMIVKKRCVLKWGCAIIAKIVYAQTVKSNYYLPHKKSEAIR